MATVAARIVGDCAEVGHLPLAPHKSVVGAVCQICGTHNLAGVIDPAGAALIAAESSDIGEYSPLPDKRVAGDITCDIGKTDDLTSVIETVSKTSCAAQCTEVNHPAAVPQERINRRNTRSGTRNGINERESSYLPTVIDEHTERIRPTQGSQITHYSLLPYKPMPGAWRRQADKISEVPWVRLGVLRSSHYLATAVYVIGQAVASAERSKIDDLILVSEISV